MIDVSDESSDDSDCGILKKCLNVEIPDDFDPNRCPTTGEEYVQHVMYEAKKCKTWVKADIDTTKFKSKQTFKVFMTEGCAKAPMHMRPTLKWQQEQIEDFKNLREYLENQEGPEINDFMHTLNWDEKIINSSPKYREVMSLSQSCKIKVLNVIDDYLEELPKGNSPLKNVQMWLYSLLVSLEIPLFPDICHLLRELARKCSHIRSNLSQDCSQEDYVALNLFICIISRYFSQLDLADN